jgi:hypothetical protein
MLLLILAIATADPSSTPGGEVQADGFTWTEQSVTWTEVPDPDPEGVLPPIKGLQSVRIEPGDQRARSGPDSRSAVEAEANVDEALRRAREAVARAEETVRAAGAK